MTLLRAPLAMLLLAGSLAVAVPGAAQNMPSAASADSEQTFGHRKGGFASPRVRSSVSFDMDIEIERNGHSFWRGRVDGRGGEVMLSTPTVSMNECDVIIVTGGGVDRPQSYNPPPRDELNLQLRLLDYERFELTFRYTRPVAPESGSRNVCTDADLRTVTLTPSFALAPGATITLRDFAGFRIRVTRP